MNDALTHALLEGQAALERDDHAAAVTAFARALALAPGQHAIALALANAHRLTGDVLAARRVLQHAVSGPDDAHVRVADWHALGAALLDVGAPVEAEACFARVAQARPDDPAVLAALAGARRTLGDPGRAWPLVQRALAASPREPAFLLTAAQVRHDLADLRGAAHWIEKADAARPGHAPTQVQRAYTSLLGGASEAGWALLEERPLPAPDSAARAWNGEPLHGSDILVTAEQGVGDQFQFLRFVRLLEGLGAARVVVECHADAVRLLTGNGFDAVARGSAPPTAWHVPLMSLPHRLRLGADVLSASVPYLRALEGSPGGLGHRGDRPRIGLVWAGNPAFPGRITRDLDPALLPRITSIDAEWISLQHGAAAELHVPGLHAGPPAGDWADTAATLAALDALVTTDTGIAHLAGAMGVRTYTLLQHVPDWRWGLRGETTPWYPGMHLLRQQRSRDWPGVVEALERALGARSGLD